MKKFLITVTIIALSVSILLFIRSFLKIPKFVEVRTPYSVNIYKIGENKEFEVDGKIGKVRIEIRDMRVRVKESSCPNKICVKTGWISRNGAIILCAPNGVLLQLLSSNK